MRQHAASGFRPVAVKYSTVPHTICIYLRHDLGQLYGHSASTCAYCANYAVAHPQQPSWRILGRWYYTRGVRCWHTFAQSRNARQGHAYAVARILRCAMQLLAALALSCAVQLQRCRCAMLCCGVLCAPPHLHPVAASAPGPTCTPGLTGTACQHCATSGLQGAN